MSVRTSPCSWPVTYSQQLQQQASLQPYFTQPASGISDYEEMATGFLWRWTGRSLGVCEVTVRPCRQDCNQRETFWGFGPYPNMGMPWIPALIGGEWFNISCGQNCGSGHCGCSGEDQLKTLMIPGPVDSIVSIIQDGVVLPSGAYRVDNFKFLIREDGNEWPKCQDMTLSLGQVGTFGIIYNWGVPVPAGGDIVAGVLATEFWKAANGDSSCGLPKRIQQISRQGVTVAFDNFSDLTKGGTGIFLIDSWVASLNQVPMRSRVLSPDLKKPRILTSNGGTGEIGFGTGPGFGR